MLRLTSVRFAASTFQKTKFYVNVFEWSDGKWGVAATINSPRLTIDNGIMKVDKQAGLSLNVYPLADKYKKGREMESYFLKMQDMLKLSAWKPSEKPLNFVNTNKIVSFQRDAKDQASILLSFYDKNLSEDLKRKELLFPLSQLSTLQLTIQAGAQQITNGQQQKLSYISELLRSFPPNQTAN